jgi:hypothetical protein
MNLASGEVWRLGRTRIIGAVVCAGACVSGCGSGMTHAPVVQQTSVAANAQSGRSVGNRAASDSTVALAKHGVRRTRVIAVRPTTNDGRLLPGFVITKTAAGKCYPESGLVAGEAYSCSAGVYLYDPCWAAGGSRAAYCMARPWLHTVAKVAVSSPLVSQAEPARAVLWGLKLVSGLRCEAHRGAAERYRGIIVQYKCGKTLGLLGAPVRTSGLWHIREVEYSRQTKGYVLGAEIPIAVAWYGASGGETGLPG